VQVNATKAASTTLVGGHGMIGFLLPSDLLDVASNFRPTRPPSNQILSHFAGFLKK
jgi:hypothetical protein